MMMEQTIGNLQDFTLHGIKINREDEGSRIVILKLPNYIKILNGFLLTSEDEIEKSSELFTISDNVNLKFILENFEEYLTEAKETDTMAVLHHSEKAVKYESRPFDKKNLANSKKTFEPEIYKNTRLCKSSQKPMQDDIRFQSSVKRNEGTDIQERQSVSPNHGKRSKDPECTDTKRIKHDDIPPASITVIQSHVTDNSWLDGKNNNLNDTTEDLFAVGETVTLDPAELSLLKQEIIENLNDGEIETDLTDDVKTESLQYHHSNDPPADVIVGPFTVPGKSTETKEHQEEATYFCKTEKTSFLCEKCDMPFQSVELLEDHYNYKHKKSCEHYCQICRKVYSSAVRLLLHNCDQLSKTYSCQACGITLETEKDVEDHNEKCCRAYIYQCKQCKKIFSAEKSMKVHHSKLKHSGFVCRVCKQIFEDSGEYYSHVNQELDVHFVCDQCAKEFRTLRALKKHVKYSHNKSLHTCKVCDWTCERLDTYQFHMHKHKTGGHICSQCGMSFITKCKLQFHLSSHQPTLCCECSSVFLGPSKMKRHMKNAHIDEYNKAVENELTNNLKFQTSDSGGRVFHCTGCNIYIDSLLKARKHLQRRKQCASRHMCNFCAEIVPSHELLKQHEVQHSGPFLCFYCNTGFVDWERCCNHVQGHIESKQENKELTHDHNYTNDNKNTDLSVICQ